LSFSERGLQAPTSWEVRSVLFGGKLKIVLKRRFPGKKIQRGTSLTLIVDKISRKKELIIFTVGRRGR